MIERLITNFHDPKHQLPPEKNELQIARLREILKTFKEELIYNDEKLNAVINQLENDNLKMKSNHYFDVLTRIMMEDYLRKIKKYQN